MTFNNALLAIGNNAVRSAVRGFQLHSDDPGVGGAANRTTAGMMVPVWTVVDDNGAFGLQSPVPFTGGPANGAVKYLSTWSDTSGIGTWYGNFPLTGDLTFDANGAYTLESFPIQGTST
jgi:hypothetical protein